ncbi:MAG: TRAP transporter small permease [Rhizobiaceae bacterium]|nr:TRAP transporter small permease [Rhizobiaceae bacterium]
MSASGEPADPPVEPQGTVARCAVWLMSAANAVSTAWIIVIMLLIVADVLGRELFLLPIVGVHEMVGFSIVGIVFLQAAHANLRGRMIRSDGLVTSIGLRRPRVQAGFDLLAHLLGAILSVALVFAIWPRMARAFARDELQGIPGHFTLPVWPMLALIVFGSAMLALSFLMAALVAWRRLRQVPS